MRLSINVDKTSSKWRRAFPGMLWKIEQAAATAFLSAKKPAAFSRRSFEVNILLTTDATIKNLNQDYRGKNKATNVLSFPQISMKKFKKNTLDIFPASAAIPLGDVVLAYETILRECKTQQKTLEEHTTHLVVHGFLHLLGYDHMRMKEAKTMENLERDILALLGYADPYHEAKPQSKKR